MQHGTLISIVMPVFNRAHLLPRVAASILGQSYRHFELLIVDDASTDDIEAAVKALGDDRVRLIRRAQNGGVAAARNSGVEAARGDWIAFHDSDDFCTTDRLDLCRQKLAELPPDYIGVYGARLIYNEVSEDDYGRAAAYVIPRPRETVLSGDLSARTMRGNIINFPTLLVRKSALLAAGPSDPLLRKNVDWDLCLRLTRQGRIGFVPEPLILTPTSLAPEVSAARVSRSARQGARSFARISGKLRRSGLTGRALSTHYATTARYLLRIGRVRAARRFLGAALAQDRRQPRLWAHYALSYLPWLHARLRRPAKL